MQTREFIVDHEVQNEFCITAIVLLPPTSAAPNFGGIAQPHFAVQLLQHGFEPRTVATCFETDNNVSCECGVETADLVFVLVFQFACDEFASFSFQIANGLLSCMKVNADIYCVHSASFQSHVHERLAREFNTHGWGLSS